MSHCRAVIVTSTLYGISAVFPDLFHYPLGGGRDGRIFESSKPDPRSQSPYATPAMTMTPLVKFAS